MKFIAKVVEKVKETVKESRKTLFFWKRPNPRVCHVRLGGGSLNSDGYEGRKSHSEFNWIAIPIIVPRVRRSEAKTGVMTIKKLMSRSGKR